MRAAREQQHKLIVADGWQELHDIDKDPGELQDLASVLPAQQGALQRELEQFLERARPVAGAETRVEDDPEVLQQLRDLGYLE